ncbi:MAG: tRNA guanosine(34) transglycosylase Tgt [Candidatus Gribaldobacteria bacterium]|nr:tRNA guanosine(34) transglycosylase Tgt [Candidatus Gribaldobacteria bacterium]
MQFKVIQQSKKSRARLGVIKTAHGDLHTPAFFPVATQAVIKTLTSDNIKQIGFEGVLANTYHLHLRPGEKIIKKMSGLHQFMNFQGVITTDSGGFQVFSLGSGIEHGVGKIAKIFPGSQSIKPSHFKCDRTGSEMVRITEEGVWFRSHLDGSQHFLNPEKSMQIQQDLSSDIAFAFDECTSPLAGMDYTQKSMERTHRWAERCILAKSKIKNNKQMLFGIMQGGEYKKLREQSAKFIGGLDFDGFGIGGSLGRTKTKMYEILDWTIPLLPNEKPRHLLGIGYLEDFEQAIKAGVDLFDCVYPTRFARHGIAITAKEKLNLNQSKFLTDKNPLDKSCACPTCQNHTRGYICHLFRAKEITGQQLLTMHNLWFFKQFIDKIRQKIADGNL